MKNKIESLIEETKLIEIKRKAFSLKDKKLDDLLRRLTERITTLSGISNDIVFSRIANEAKSLSAEAQSYTMILEAQSVVGKEEQDILTKEVRQLTQNKTKVLNRWNADDGGFSVVYEQSSIQSGIAIIRSVIPKLKISYEIEECISEYSEKYGANFFNVEKLIHLIDEVVIGANEKIGVTEGRPLEDIKEESRKSFSLEMESQVLMEKAYSLLDEAEICYQVGAFLASGVMYGSAVECILIDIADQNYEEISKQKRFDKNKFDLTDIKFVTLIDALRKSGDLEKRFSSHSDTIFNLIRKLRNHVHPSKVIVEPNFSFGKAECDLIRSNLEYLFGKPDRS